MSRDQQYIGRYSPKWTPAEVVRHHGVVVGKMRRKLFVVSLWHVPGHAIAIVTFVRGSQVSGSG